MKGRDTEKVFRGKWLIAVSIVVAAVGYFALAPAIVGYQFRPSALSSGAGAGGALSRIAHHFTWPALWCAAKNGLYSDYFEAVAKYSSGGRGIIVTDDGNLIVRL